MTNEEAIEILREEHNYCQEPYFVIKAIEKAIEALSKYSADKPLTLEQLRDMDGEVVLIGDSNGIIAEKAFVRAERGFLSGQDRTKYYFECLGKPISPTPTLPPTSTGRRGSRAETVLQTVRGAKIMMKI